MSAGRGRLPWAEFTVLWGPTLSPRPLPVQLTVALRALRPVRTSPTWICCSLKKDFKKTYNVFLWLCWVFVEAQDL